MNNLKMFCITLEPNHFDFIKELGYEPVGLGVNKFSKEWLSDRSNTNISKKNKYYGEYTFHYWLWKNYLNEIKSNWIGFCQYRKFWTLENPSNKSIKLDSLKKIVLNEIPKEYNRYDAILGEPIYINQMKPMKFLKKGVKLIAKNPLLLFNEKKRNIKFHFDLMHGDGNLLKAIELLDNENKYDFLKFVNDEMSFNPHNMFICRSKEILQKYYEDLFTWLEKCETLFGFDDLKGYGKIRIYGFLAERFMSYWFKKNTNYRDLPIIFYDIKKNLN
jgi:hypothetical protein